MKPSEAKKSIAILEQSIKDIEARIQEVKDSGMSGETKQYFIGNERYIINRKCEKIEQLKIYL